MCVVYEMGILGEEVAGVCCDGGMVPCERRTDGCRTHLETPRIVTAYHIHMGIHTYALYLPAEGVGAGGADRKQDRVPLVADAALAGRSPVLFVHALMCVYVCARISACIHVYPSIDQSMMTRLLSQPLHPITNTYRTGQ